MTKSGTLGTNSKVECPKFRFLWFFFANWTILSDLKQKKIFRKISTDGRFWSLWAHGENYIFWTDFFLDLKFSGMLLHNIIYHFWEFRKNQISKNLPKKNQSVNYGHFWPLWLPGEIFNFWRRIFLDLKFSGIVPSNIIYHF